MRVIIRTDTSGIPCNLDAYTAFLGFKKLGYECTFFQKYEDLVKIHHNIEEPIVAESEIVNRRLEDLGIKNSVLKIPDEIAEIFGRLIWKTTIQFLKKKPELWPVSVQSFGSKKLIKRVIRSQQDLDAFINEDENIEVLCGTPINFVAECRAFVRHGEILDVRPYKGKWSIHCDSSVIEKAVKKYTSAPDAYSLDFGVTEEGSTLLISVNENIANECYGLSSEQYAKFLATQWEVIKKNNLLTIKK